MSAKAKRWAVEEWGQFFKDCHQVRDRLRALCGTFPMTPGLTNPRLLKWVHTWDEWFEAMSGMEGEFCESGITVTDFSDFVWGPTRHGIGPCEVKVPRNAPPLTREQWIEWGCEIKAIRRSMMDLSERSRKVVNKTLNLRFSKAIAKLDRAKLSFEAIARQQHPDWDEVPRLFFGDPTGDAS